VADLAQQRRMIFPERVFGNMSAKRISSGRASADFFRDMLAQLLFSASVGVRPLPG